MKSVLAAIIMAAAALPHLAAAQDVVVPVHLDLYDGDRLTKDFAEALRNAVSNDSRFTVVDPAPADGVNVVMKESLKPEDADSRLIAAYEVNLKLGSGKFLRTLTGYCDQKKLDMCGRVVAEDIYTTYADWAKSHKK